MTPPKKLEELTPAQDRLASEIAEQYIADLTKPTPPRTAAINAWLKVVYGLYDKLVPDRVEIVDSPHAACRLATELTGEKQTGTDYCGVGDGGWISFYDFFERIGVISNDEAREVMALRDFSRVAWDTFLLDECAIVIRRPVALRVDDAGDLHAVGKPCIEWADGERDWAWHGTWVSQKIAEEPRSHTKEEYTAITNTEERRALSEAAGWDWVAKLLGAKIEDSWTDPTTGLRYELLRSGATAILSKLSPPLANGSQPRYLEPVHENLHTARAARKWQATQLTPEECESDPELRYDVEA